MKLRRRKRTLRRLNDLEFQGMVENWTRKELRKNLWRIESGVVGIEDLMQDSFLLFEKIKRKYKYVDENRWLFALYKTAFFNELVDLSKANSKRLEFEVELKEQETEFYGDVSWQRLRVRERFLSGLPSEVKKVMFIFLNCPDEVFQIGVKAIHRNKPFLIRDIFGLSLCEVKEAIDYLKSTLDEGE